ncbi:MAG: DUF72 domain-containing protein [Deltaproteobacteria bacterium]|nr:DUF72 domain-containing protein [Deltaproteobacteria bacterium]
MIRVGPAGWSYKDWEGIVYPTQKGSKFDSLAYLSEYFDTIELNNTFYRPPTTQMGRSWAKRVQSNPNFRFTAKLYRNFTHERQALTEGDAALFKSGLAPLVENQRLGALLLQFPYSFHHKEENLGYLKALAEKFREYPLVLEVRHASWDRASAYQFLRETGIGFCNIDQPQVSYSIGATKKVTSKVGYLRLHGRNVKEWFREGAGRDARYDYLYNEFEIFELAERIRQLAQEAEEVYVITNNHYRGKAICNALEIKAKLREPGLKIPEILLQHYPQLKEIPEEKEA